MDQITVLSVSVLLLDAKNFIFDNQSFINYAKRISDKNTRLEVANVTSSIQDFLETDADIYYMHFGEIKKPSSKIGTLLEVLEGRSDKTAMYVIISTKELIGILNSSFLKRGNVVFYKTNSIGETKDA